MQLHLVHHADAVESDADPQRPLSPTGRDQAERVARRAAAAGARPAVVWHSGKLRARQTAEVCRHTCNALAELSATRDLQPTDPPQAMRDRLRGETRDILIVGHFPHLFRLLEVLIGGSGEPVPFPPHGIVALGSDDDGASWRELWRWGPGANRG